MPIAPMSELALKAWAPLSLLMLLSWLWGLKAKDEIFLQKLKVGLWGGGGDFRHYRSQ